MCRFLGPNKNFLYLLTYFFFQSSPTFWVIGKLKTLNSLLDVFGPMAFYLFFNFFGNSVQSRLKKGIPCFNESSFDFSFLFYKKLNKEWYAGFWFDSFFRKIVMNTHVRISKNDGRIVNDIDRVRVIRRDKIENLIL